MFFVKIGIILIISVGCGGIKFDPDIHMGDYLNESIVNERGERVYCNAPEFNEYGSMHKVKWKELKEILRRAKLPRRTKRLLRKGIQKLDRSIHEVSKKYIDRDRP